MLNVPSVMSASRRRLIKLLRAVLEPGAAVFVRISFLSHRCAIQTTHGRHAGVAVLMVVVVAGAALERELCLVYKVSRGRERVVVAVGGDACCVIHIVRKVSIIVAAVRDGRRCRRHHDAARRRVVLGCGRHHGKLILEQLRMQVAVFDFGARAATTSSSHVNRQTRTNY
ncbi:hypothetical protein H257_06980 [Aphanomyces astaci]|uniref:Uncharacterized protein n=1 Tax=Aphanomyces astaci TaxID=112090 RepID=W4GL30_APHAT|nr:hypothetical protein H257_06980 [Aphanomyces astaci]ETV79749.1 hypothetical protein H257_06980 [Aphanomyces astaci]|eukprot:XP_009830685.1 hypothetical protein H257_06980 [Aphanomyces astaci]